MQTSARASLDLNKRGDAGESLSGDDGDLGSASVEVCSSASLVSDSPDAELVINGVLLFVKSTQNLVADSFSSAIRSTSLSISHLIGVLLYAFSP